MELSTVRVFICDSTLESQSSLELSCWRTEGRPGHFATISTVTVKTDRTDACHLFYWSAVRAIEFDCSPTLSVT